MPSEAHAELRRGENPAVAWVDTNDRGDSQACWLVGFFDLKTPAEYTKN